jgi:hypothetical protein
MLFAKNKPTKKMTFGDDWVELQHLSKGAKDNYQAKQIVLVSKLKSIDEATMKKIEAGDISSIPENMENIATDIMSLKYEMVTSAIVKWSSLEEITENNVKALDEAVFDEIENAISEMNTLNENERKN